MRYTIAIVAILISSTPALANDRPNVIVILADDMGLDSVSAFNSRMGMTTPAIDQLAREGMSFTDAHSTSSVCSPTRYGLLTGRYNWRSRLKRGIVGKWERPLFEDERLTLPEMFREKGYDTACIGKWHLGWHWPKKGGGTTEKLDEIDFTKPIKGGPCDHGFDYYFGDDVPNWPPYAWRENDRVLGQLTTTMKQAAMVGVNSGPSVENWDFRAVLAEYTRRWSDYIRGRADQERPFFLYVPMPSPHTPIAPHDDFRGESKVSEYADFLIQTDHAVGTITAALDEAELMDNTVVVFTCDNGTSPQADFAQLDVAGIHLNEHWRGWKADAYEGGHRVPFIVRWPGKIEADTRSTQTITLADIMATCADVIGYELPASAAEDSISLLPTLRGESVQEPLHEIVVHHSGSGHFAVRKDKWKLLFCRGSGGWSPPREPVAEKQGLPTLQLYNLADDPKETTNLQSRRPEIVNEMTKIFRRIIEQGRSTPGPKQSNHDGVQWWPGLPWKQPFLARNAVAGAGWRQLQDMPAGKWEPGTVMLDDKLYLFGGYTKGVKSSKRCDVFDPKDNSWTRIQDLPSAITHMNMVLDGRTVWFAGGFKDGYKGHTIAEVWSYDIDKDRYTAAPLLPDTRGGGGLALLDRSLHFMGGVMADRDTDAEDHWVLDLDEWSKGSARWETAAPLPAPRNQFSTVTFEGKIYVIGGQFHHDSQQLDQPRVDIYDPKTDSWSRGPQLPKGHSHSEGGTFVSDGRIYMVGGHTTPEGGRKQIDADILALDPDGWKLVGKLPMPISSPAAAMIRGKLYVAGGSPNGSSVQGKMWVREAP